MFFLGLALFIGVHVLTALPMRVTVREAMGEKTYKAVYSVISVIGLGLMIYGYTDAHNAYRGTLLYQPPAFLKHIAMLLVLFAFWGLAATNSKGKIHALVQHPQVLGVKLWAFAHLLANGDLFSVIFFGSFLAWAVIARVSYKRRGVTGPDRNVSFGLRDVLVIVIGTVLYGAFAFWAHPAWIGVPVAG